MIRFDSPAPLIDCHREDDAIAWLPINMRAKAKNQWDFDPNALTARWVLIIFALLVLFFVFGIQVSHEAFVRWGGLAFYSIGIFGFFVNDSREYFGARKFWIRTANLLALHLTGWTILLKHVHEWRSIWFSIMIIEWPVLSRLRDRPGFLD